MTRQTKTCTCTGGTWRLISKAAVYAATKHISRIALAPLAGNPFPDATPEFLSTFSTALSLGLDAPIDIVAPYADMHKEDVIRRGATWVCHSS